MLLAPLFGRVGGVFVAFLVPFLDIGIGQSPMLRDEPAAWAHTAPGYGAGRMLIDGALTSGFDAAWPLLLSLGWAAGLAILVAVVFHRTTATR
jgi:hypothetical protein